MNKVSENEVKEALKYIDADDRDTWIKVGMALKSGGFDVSIYNDWSATSEKYKDGEPLRKWKGFKKSGISIGTLFYLARQGGYTGNHGKHIAEYVSDSEAEVQPLADEYILPDLMDKILQYHDALLGNAERMHYLTDIRQIPIDILEKYKVGFSQNGFNDCLLDQGRINEILSHNYTTIFPFFDSEEAVRYVVGEIDDRSKVNRYGEPLSKYCKPKDINQPVFNSRYLKMDIKTIFITEGIYDALSIEAVQYPCMALAGISYGAFINDLKRYQVPKDRTFIICLDNDETGRKTAQELKTELDKLGYFSLVHHFSEKDANEAWCYDPVSFCNEVNEVAESAQSQFLEWLSEKEKELIGAEQNADRLKVISWDSIQEKKMEWIWYPYIPKGKVSIIQGTPGAGKTFFECQFIADLTTGRPFIGASDNFNIDGTERKPMNVLYQIIEDDANDTLVPRLKKAGADMKRIISVPETDECPLKFGDPRIKKAIIENDISVAVFDPLVNYLGGKADMNKANDVRAIMQKIVNVAKETGCAVLIIAHTNKMSSEKNAMNRLSGSVDFLASVRSMMTLGTDPDDKEIKAFALTKNNLSAGAGTILFKITMDDDSEGLLKFVGYSDLSSDEIIQTPQSKKGSPKLEEAKNLLMTMLSGTGQVKQADLEREYKKRGLSKNTIYRAKDVLGIKSELIYENNERCWIWKKPKQ